MVVMSFTVVRCHLKVSGFQAARLMIVKSDDKRLKDLR